MAASHIQGSRCYPPPPYNQEGDEIYTHRPPNQGLHGTTFATSSHSYYPGHQTTPKSAEAGEMSSVANKREVKKSNASQQHTQRLNELNGHHTCASAAHRRVQLGNSDRHANGGPVERSLQPNGNSKSNDPFVRSLAAPKSFLGHMYIEPLAFLAILALYIEFPAIQDLIYTKICLEVIGRHPDLSLAQHRTLPIDHAFLNTSSLYNNTSSGVSNLTQQTLALVDANQSLPTNGRIQQASLLGNGTQPPQSSLIIPDLSPSNHQYEPRQQHLLCNRLNKTAVPRSVRQEILEIDSLFWLKYQILTCLLCALASPYWGGLSDKIGRLIPLNAPIVAGVMCNGISLAFGLVISMDSHSLFHINWLFLGAVMVGLSGGQAVLIMNAFSFLSDNTTSEERSKRVATLESVIFVAHSVGFFLSKMIMLLGLAPPDRPWLNRHFVAFASCILLNLISILYSAARLRHHKFHRFLNNYEREQQEAAIMGSDSSLGGTSSCSLGGPGIRRKGELASGAGGHLGTGERLRELTSSTPDDPDGPISRSDRTNWTFWDAMVTFRYYKETFEVATKKRDTRPTILLLLLAGFISSLSLAALMSLLFVYVKMDPFNWTTSQYSSWNSISSITRGVALISLTIMMRFAPFWNVPDAAVAGVGFLGKAAGLIMIGLAHSSATLNWSLVAFTLSEYSMPPIRSLLSKLVIRDELGKVYSCLGTLQSLCFILGNIAFYAAFTSYTRQEFFRISFLVVGGIELGAVIVMLMVYYSAR